jgi:hypothetical protein
MYIRKPLRCSQQNVTQSDSHFWRIVLGWEEDISSAVRMEAGQSGRLLWESGKRRQWLG